MGLDALIITARHMIEAAMPRTTRGWRICQPGRDLQPRKKCGFTQRLVTSRHFNVQSGISYATGKARSSWLRCSEGFLG